MRSRRATSLAIIASMSCALAAGFTGTAPSPGCSEAAAGPETATESMPAGAVDEPAIAPGAVAAAVLMAAATGGAAGGVGAAIVDAAAATLAAAAAVAAAAAASAFAAM